LNRRPDSDAVNKTVLAIEQNQELWWSGMGPVVVSAPVQYPRTGGLIGWEPFWLKADQAAENLYGKSCGSLAKEGNLTGNRVATQDRFGWGAAHRFPIWSIQELLALKLDAVRGEMPNGTVI
jgi:hypothetical protein